MQNFSTSPREMVASFWRNRTLIYALSKREVVGRYRGSSFGILWSFFNQLLMLVVYTFVFSVAFRARWPGGVGSTAEFGLMIFVGIIFFNFFAECVVSAPAQILDNPNYINKVVFPLEVLSWVSLLTASFHTLIGFCVWLLSYTFLFGLPHITVLLLPLVFIPFGLMTLGICWFLSAVGVYVRDIRQIIGIFVSALMFLSPIFYSVKSLPDRIQEIIAFNPLSFPIEQARALLFWSIMPPFIQSIYYLLFCIFICCISFAFFQKMRKGFADAL